MPQASSTSEGAEGAHNYGGSDLRRAHSTTPRFSELADAGGGWTDASADDADLTSLKRNALECCTFGGGGGIDGSSAGGYDEKGTLPVSRPDSVRSLIMLTAIRGTCGREACWLVHAGEHCRESL